jgi:sortase (surface protein transpeptidase)
MKRHNAIKWVVNIYSFLGFSFLIIAFLLVLTPVIPYIAYRLNPEETNNEVTKISQPVVDDNVEIQAPVITNNTPTIDPTLPTTPYISITKIGVYSPISTIANYKEALKQGAWLVPEYGTPANDKKPIIIAAHRFGYIYWDNATRKKVSFYNLPKTTNGDTIDIIWGQRKYTYTIYAQSEGTVITDYSADLVLYTCKYFDSPVRIFRYAKLTVL